MRRGVSMEYLDCSKVTIPAPFVKSISWTKRARTIKHYGGYISSRGFETTEISVKVSIDYQTCLTFGLNPSEQYANIESIHTDRIDEPSLFRWFGYAIYPELEFALTNINKTYISDNASNVSPAIECDLIFSGVKAVKNVSRERALSLDPVPSIPEIRISVDEKELVIQDSIQINRFITTFDSIDLSVNIGSDLDFVSRDSFLERIAQDGVIFADLPQGKTKYYVISASLVDETLNIFGSVFSKKAAQTLVKTYSATSIQEIIKDLCAFAEIDCNILISGRVDYFRAFGTPLDIIKSLQDSAGFIMSIRKGVLTIAEVPDQIFGETEILYNEMTEDSKKEPISGVYWYDGINKFSHGKIDEKSIKIYSSFRSEQDYSELCYKYLNYMQNLINIESDLMSNIDAHSEILINSNNSIINCMVEFCAFDWLNNTMQAECHYLGA